MNSFQSMPSTLESPTALLGENPPTTNSAALQVPSVCERDDIDKAAYDFFNVLLYHKSEDVLKRWHHPNEEYIAFTDFVLTTPARFVKGGQGYVCTVVQKNKEKVYAMKMKLMDSKSKLSRSVEQREYFLLSGVRHEFIVKLFHVFCTPGSIFLVMEYLEGGCLWSHVAYNGLLSEENTIYFSACILDALQYLHSANIIYRDLKAENVVLDGRNRPKLIDFGMAKFLYNSENDDGKESKFNTQYSYAGYLPPEIYTRTDPVTDKIDVWGLGYLISEIHLGFGIFRPIPWDGVHRQNLLPSWNLEISPKVNCSGVCLDLLHRLLKRFPWQRPRLCHVALHKFYKDISWSALGKLDGPKMPRLPMHRYAKSKPKNNTFNNNVSCGQNVQRSSAAEASEERRSQLRKFSRPSTHHQAPSISMAQEKLLRRMGVNRSNSKVVSSFTHTVGNLDPQFEF